jgi:hypothetical protein
MVNLHNWFDVSEIELRIKKKNAEKLGNFASREPAVFGLAGRVQHREYFPA